MIFQRACTNPARIVYISPDQIIYAEDLRTKRIVGFLLPKFVHFKADSLKSLKQQGVIIGAELEINFNDKGLISHVHLL